MYCLLGDVIYNPQRLPSQIRSLRMCHVVRSGLQAIPLICCLHLNCFIVTELHADDLLVIFQILLKVSYFTLELFPVLFLSV